MDEAKQERNRAIVEALVLHGRAVLELSREWGISPQRVRQIVRRYKERLGRRDTRNGRLYGEGRPF